MIVKKAYCLTFASFSLSQASFLLYPYLCLPIRPALLTLDYLWRHSRHYYFCILHSWSWPWAHEILPFPSSSHLHCIQYYVYFICIAPWNPENVFIILLQLIYRPDNGEILGVHIFGLHAADLIHEASNAIALGTRIQVYFFYFQ